MEELYEVGGVPAVQRLLLREGLLHGDCLTVTGKTLAENLDELPDLTARAKDHLSRQRSDQANRASANSLWQPGDRRRGGKDYGQRGLAL